MTGAGPGGNWPAWDSYVWGGWAGSEDNADFIPASIGWDAWMIHGEGDTHRTLVGYAADGSVHYNDNRDSPQWDQTAQLHPICVRETTTTCDVGAVVAEACWDSGPEANGNGHGFVLY